MEDLNATLTALLADPAAVPPAEWVEAMRRDHPAWTLPDALLLQRAAADMPAAQRQELQMRLAINSPDRAALVEMVDIDGSQWAALYPPAEPAQAPSTDSAIDTFLSTYGSSSPQETALLEQMIFNPAPADYFSDAEAPADSAQDDLANLANLANVATPSEEANIANEAADPESPAEPASQPAPAEPQTPPAPEPAGNSLLSESLAKIFIKQGRYERAYEIISDLNLKFPEKSVYFADQLRFLRKLIKIQQQKPRD